MNELVRTIQQDLPDHPPTINPDDPRFDEFDMSPTEKTAHSFDVAYRFMNYVLFGDALPDCLITLQRRKGSYGYFSHEKFSRRHGVGVTDEIALNPATFLERKDREIVSTLL